MQQIYFALPKYGQRNSELGLRNSMLSEAYKYPEPHLSSLENKFINLIPWWLLRLQGSSKRQPAPAFRAPEQRAQEAPSIAVLSFPGSPRPAARTAQLVLYLMMLFIGLFVCPDIPYMVNYMIAPWGLYAFMFILFHSL